MSLPVFFETRHKLLGPSPNRTTKKMAAVVTQPAEGKGAQMQMIAQPPPTVMMPQGLPPGLAYLGGLPEIRIHQIFDMLEGKLHNANACREVVWWVSRNLRTGYIHEMTTLFFV